jgi:hypothetical protein
MKIDTERRLELASPMVAGNRTIIVVSELLSMRSQMNMIFAILVTPIALIILEGIQHYAISLTKESTMSIKELMLEEPMLQEKLSFLLSHS